MGASSPASGSSSSSNVGRSVIARANCKRWRCPPLSSRGRRRSSERSSPTCSMESCASRLRSSLGRSRRRMSSGSRTISSASHWGFIDIDASCITSCTLRRKCRSALPRRSRSGFPSKNTSPASGASSAARQRSNVLLPLPDSPTTDSSAPRPTSILTSSMATMPE